MSGPTIDDAIGAAGLEAATLPTPDQEAVQAVQPRGIDLSFLKAKTGEGAIEDYIEHPMNFNKSKSLAQIIRGMTGMLGALDLAIFDIVIGGLNFSKERKMPIA
jgi:hypothetical protein